MGHEGKPRRQAVNLSLPSDLVARARACTDNLSGTVEELLAGFVAEEEARRQEEEGRTDRVVEALGRFMQKGDTIADDFSPL